MEENKNPYINLEELEVIELIRFVEDNKLDKDPRINALLTSLAHNPVNIERKAQLVKMIKPRMIKNLLSPDPFSPYPEDDEVDGEIKLGVCPETNASFGLNINELMQGTLAVGRPGAGKTTFTYNIIQRANELGIHCLIIDIKKDYRHIIRKLPDTLVFRSDDESFKWNPLQIPEGVGRVNLITNFADITSEAFYVQDGTNNYIVEHLNRIYNILEQPTVMDLYNAISRDNPKLITRDARYRESALNRLASIIVKMGKAFSHMKGYKIEKLIDDYNVVVEIDNLGHKGRIYLTPLILAHVFQHRIANNLRGIKQKPALVIVDEGNEIFDKNLERQMGGLTLTTMVREAREFQLGIMCSCQVPEAISDTVKNVYTRVLLSLPEGANLKNFAESMGLNKEQMESNFSLEPGQAVVRLAGRYDKPFLVQFNEYPLEKDVSNEEIKEHMKPILERLDEELGLRQDEVTVVTEAKPEEKLSDDERRLFYNIYDDPFKNITERYKGLRGFTAAKIMDLVKKFERKGLIKAIEISEGKKGNVPKYIAFTKEGFKAINVEPNHKIDDSNFEHSFWQKKIYNHFGKEYKAEEEKIVYYNEKEKRIDVGVEFDAKLIAIEVAMTDAYEKQNIIRDLGAGCFFVIIGCKNDLVLNSVSKIIEGIDEKKKSKARALLLKEITKYSIKELIK